MIFLETGEREQIEDSGSKLSEQRMTFNVAIPINAKVQNQFVGPAAETVQNPGPQTTPGT